MGSYTATCLSSHLYLVDVKSPSSSSSLLALCFGLIIQSVDGVFPFHPVSDGTSDDTVYMI